MNLVSNKSFLFNNRASRFGTEGQSGNACNIIYNIVYNIEKSPLVLFLGRTCTVTIPIFPQLSDREWIKHMAITSNKEKFGVIFEQLARCFCLEIKSEVIILQRYHCITEHIVVEWNIYSYMRFTVKLSKCTVLSYRHDYHISWHLSEIFHCMMHVKEKIQSAPLC